MKNDTGDVLCIADNGVPPLVSQKFELTIHCKYRKVPPQLCLSQLTQPFILDKPRISVFMDEFNQPYNEGFIKVMCRIDAVPLPDQYEMRIGGKI